VETNGFDEKNSAQETFGAGLRGRRWRGSVSLCSMVSLAEWSCLYSNKKKKGKTTTKDLKNSIAMVETHHFVYIIFPCNQVCKVVIQGGS